MLVEKKSSNLTISKNKSNFECWNNGEFLNFFIEYLQKHTYFKSKHIIKAFFCKIQLPNILVKEYYRKFVTRQLYYIRIAHKTGYIEPYNNFTYKHTRKVQNPRPLIRELKKIKFKS